MKDLRIEHLDTYSEVYYKGHYCGSISREAVFSYNDRTPKRVFNYFYNRDFICKGYKY